jgi:NitT/TauT family transport system substrate-binding protein
MSRLVGMGLLSLWLIACQALPAGPAGRGAQPPAAAAPTTVTEPAATAPAGPLQVVRVGGVGTASEVTYYWAQERGYLREEGLDLEFEIFSGAQQMIPPLGTGQLDVGSGAPGPGLFNAILRGVNVRIVADRSRAAPGTRNQCLMVRKSLLDSGAVRSFADWRGRTFAENVPGVSTTSLIDRELQRAGLSLQDVNVVTLSFPDMLTGFVNGVVDFGILVEPFMTWGEEQGVIQCWKPTSELGPNFQISVLLYSPVFSEQRADAARRFMVAHLRAIRDYHRAFFGDGQGRDEFLQLMARVSAVQDVGLLARLYPSWSDPNGTPNVETLRDLQRWYIGRGEQISEVDLDKIVDMRFVDYALSRIGRYPGS